MQAEIKLGTNMNDALPGKIWRALTLSLALILSNFANAEEFDFSGGGSLLEEEVFLKVDEAFALSTSLLDGVVTARWDMPDGYYLYRHQFNAETKDARGFVLGEAQIPPGKAKFDEYFGDVEVYYHSAEMRVPIATDGTSATGQIGIEYQGCADKGLCYPPEVKWFVFDGGSLQSAELVQTGLDDSGTSASSVTQNGSQEEVNAAALIADTEEEILAGILADENLLKALALFFLAGIGLAFTPCVLPMVPILSSIIVGEGEGISNRRAFSLSLAYVIGMAITYAFIGTLVGLFGAELNLQAALQSAPVLVFFAIVFVILSLAMFGFYELQMPQSWQDKLNNVSQQQKGGKHLSVLAMGSVSSLVVSPCVSAPLAGALIYISTTNDAVLGGLALLCLGLGMGVPLMAVGASGGQWLPRAGAWMNGVKAVFGVLLLGVAIWLVERIVAPSITLALWGVLLLGSAVYLGVLDSAPRQGIAQFGKAVGVVSFVWGILLLVGAGSGANDPLRPLGAVVASHAGATASGAQYATHDDWQAVKSLDDVQAKIMTSPKPVLLDLYADWCISCKVMERNVFPKPAVAGLLAQFTLLRADVTHNDETDQALLNAYGLFGPPSLVFFSGDGSEIEEVRIQGEVDADALERHLEAVLNLFNQQNVGNIAANF
ncbi:MAG: protein-disulfide reductase DsbD [Pseudomonadales bacterium]|nr:protein-disulfide reductase DsbD [Pseudomonadales bacterium]